MEESESMPDLENSMPKVKLRIVGSRIKHLLKSQCLDYTLIEVGSKENAPTEFSILVEGTLEYGEQSCGWNVFVEMRDDRIISALYNAPSLKPSAAENFSIELSGNAVLAQPDLNRSQMYGIAERAVQVAQNRLLQMKRHSHSVANLLVEMNNAKVPLYVKISGVKDE